MATMTLAQIILSCVVLMLSYTVGLTYQRAVLQRKTEDDLGASAGCLPMKGRTRGKMPFALDLVKKLWAANRDEHLLAFQQTFLDQEGPNLEQRLLGNVGLVTLEPENVRTILTKKSRDGDLEFSFGLRSNAFHPQLGDGVFTLEGAAWKHSRELLRRQFARIRYQNLEVFRQCTDSLLGRLSSNEPGAIDLAPLFFKYTLDTTTLLLFGESAGSLEENSGDKFGRYFDEASWISGIRAKLVDFYWVYTPRRYLRACDEVKKYADQYIAKALDSQNQQQDDDGDRYHFIISLNEALTDRVAVRDQLINVLLAGRDTTACCLSWAL